MPLPGFLQNLTTEGSALVDPETGQPMFVGKPQDVLRKATRAVTSASPLTGTDPLNPQINQQALDALPSIGKPSYSQAVSPMGGDLGDPALTKGGKLISFLTRMAQGGLAGRAAAEQAVAQSGGHSTVGAGTGYQAAQQAQVQRAMIPAQMEQAQTQAALSRAELQPVQTPYGQMPTGLALKGMLPALLKGQYGLAGKQLESQSRENVAQIGAQTQEKIHRFIPVSGVGLFDSQTRQIMPATAEGIEITPEIAQDHDLPPAFIGKRMNLQQLAAVQRSDVFANMGMMTAQGPIVVNRRTSQATPVKGPQGQFYEPTALASTVEVGDPNNPGQTLRVRQGSAAGMPGVQSASVQVPRQAMKTEVPTKIGDQYVAFTTMIQHAELLRDAARALQNGDIQTLAGLKNAFKNEFGYAGPITAKAIADAYGGEVTNVIAKGHITDAEMAKTGKTLDPAKQNFETVNQVLNGYQALAQSKMNMLNQQEEAAVQKSQPKAKGKSKEIHYKIVNGQLVAQ